VAQALATALAADGEPILLAISLYVHVLPYRILWSSSKVTGRSLLLSR
jgi:hypothetical protein